MSFAPDVQHSQLKGSLCFVMGREVREAHVYGMVLMYLYVTSRQMSRCFITLYIHY